MSNCFVSNGVFDSAAHSIRERLYKESKSREEGRRVRGPGSRGERAARKGRPGPKRTRGRLRRGGEERPMHDYIEMWELRVVDCGS